MTAALTRHSSLDSGSARVPLLVIGNTDISSRETVTNCNTAHCQAGLEQQVNWMSDNRRQITKLLEPSIGFGRRLCVGLTGCSCV